MKRVLIGVCIVAFLGVCLLIARWLNADSVERGLVVELLRAQARADAPGMLRWVHCPDRACVRLVRTNARRLRSRGDLKVVFYESGTTHALSARTKPARVVWITSGRSLTVVQCVLVQRGGNALAGPSVRLLRVSAPIGRKSSCP